MATFKDACFHYRKITKINRELLKIGANSIWTPVRSDKIKGWCIECCQLTELVFCSGCSLAHVCQWCVRNKRCFLDSQPHLLKLRTFEAPITKEKLQCVISMYNMLFPINENIINRFKKNVKQKKCRNEFNATWYNQLLLPITLNAAVFKFQSRIVYVFGFYEGTTACGYLPYRMVNCIDIYDRLLLDSVNFDRMSALPSDLQALYAQKYFKISRLPSMKLRQVYYSDFTKQNLITKYRTKTRITHRNVSKINWDTDIELHNDLMHNKHRILTALTTAEEKQFEVHDVNLGRIKADMFELGHHCKPNYISSNHWQPASRVSLCRWCNIKYAFRNMDWRMESMYNELMSFIQSCYKSNANVDHCSSIESVYPMVRNVFWHSTTKYIDETLEKLFNMMNPVNIDNQKVISFHWQIDLSLYLHIKMILKTEALPFMLKVHEFQSIVKGIINQWCDFSKVSELPICVESTDTLLRMYEQGELSEEYELLISDSDGDE
uniref:Non-structural protein 1 n=1 Tax=Rotavirus A (isolate RVA/Equine/United Kingdom/L338/1988/G13P12[18]) TaxID=36441 RepID=NSP1_ROTEL|nr:RecName: Full=Non-structural protein 1; Short=NSP1; AltName: Full=NCVP2; AltName: Full=Non-structural RNA-binding protein 53; Short=NS53 [Equine rotavirus L338/G13]BAA20549.1 NSP1 [Equine rotavirus]